MPGYIYLEPPTPSRFAVPVGLSLAEVRDLGRAASARQRELDTVLAQERRKELDARHRYDGAQAERIEVTRYISELTRISSRLARAEEATEH